MTTTELIEKHGIGHNCLSDAYDLGYQEGRADKYREITSEYMLLTEKQVVEIRADAIDECIKFIKDHSGKHYIDCDGHFGGELETVFNLEEWMYDLEQLKEQKE